MRIPRSPTGDAASQGESGFTLLELLVTLTIASLLIAIAAPMMAKGVSHARLRATAERIASALRDARAQAAQTAEPAVFAIDASGQSFSVAGKQVAVPSGEKIGFQPFIAPGAGQPVSRELEFLPDGGATGGTISIADDRMVLRVEVDWLSGRISVRD